MLETIAVFLGCAAVFIAAMAPSVTFGDAGEFSACASFWGVPHAPGYPIYTAAAKALGTAAPFGNWAYRTNLLSALCAAAALAVLVDGLRRAGMRLGPRLAAAAVLGFSRGFLNEAVATEVFAPHLLLLAALLWLACRFAGRLFEDRPMAALGLVSGLAVANHQTFVLALPAVLVDGWLSSRPEPRRLLRGLSIAAAFGLLGLAVYLAVPLRAVKEPPLNWDHATDWARLTHVLLRKDYGSLSLTVEGAQGPRGAAAVLAQLGRFGSVSVAGLGWAAAGLAAAGVFLWNSAGLRPGLALPVLWVLMTGPFFLALGNPPFDAQTSSALERFYLAPWLGVAVLAGAALHRLSERIRAARWAAATVAVIPAFAAAAAAPAWVERSDFAAYDYGRSVLKSLPPRASFFIDGGDDTFYTTAFLTYAQGLRADLDIHDRGGLVFPSVYGPDFRSLDAARKQERRRQAESVAAREGRLFYGTFKDEIIPGLALAPWGLVRRAASPPQAVPDLWAVYPRRWEDAGLAARYRDRALIAVYPMMRAIDLAARGSLAPAADSLRQAWAMAADALWLEGNAAYLLGTIGYRACARGDWASAEKALALARRVDPKSADGLLNLGVVYEKTGRTAQAEQAYREAAALDPSSSRAYFNLGALYWGQERWTQASAAFAEALKRKPGDPALARWAEQSRRRAGR